MIITKIAETKIGSKNFEYYKNLGYDVKYGNIIKVNIEHLLRKSRSIVKVKCDICGTEKELEYGSYRKNFDKYQLYCCSTKCSKIKEHLTNIEKYGENYQEKRTKNRKKTNLDRYGNEDVNQIEEFKTKQKETSMKNGGFTFQREGSHEHLKKVMIENYGVESSMLNPESLEKSKQTCLKNYGVEFASSSKEVRDKVKQTTLKNYGVEFYSQTKEWKDKLDNYYSSKFDYESHSAFMKYKKLIRKYTNRNKKRLLENWNGYDFYSNEYIKENLSIDPNNKNYPTIDHKISVLYGFKHNISPKDIANINNLYITTRSINSSKGPKNDYKIIVKSSTGNS